jgi:hypothetical protein
MFSPNSHIHVNYAQSASDGGWLAHLAATPDPKTRFQKKIA